MIHKITRPNRGVSHSPFLFHSFFTLVGAEPIRSIQHLGEWLQGEAARVLPKSPIGEAIAYTLANWPALSRYVEAEFLSIDNNASENAMRPIAVGLKNWLFCGSDAGGKTAATLMSLTSSCKAWNLDPFAYLRDMLDCVSTHPASRIADLLPDCWKRAESTEPAEKKSHRPAPEGPVAAQ